jgi:hypothetical protein
VIGPVMAKATECGGLDVDIWTTDRPAGRNSSIDEF